MHQKKHLSYAIGPCEKALNNQTIGKFFQNIVDKFPNNDALIVKHQNIRWTYKQYNKEINKLALGLLDIGIKKGDRVGIWAPNCYEWALTQIATAKIGAIMVCMNPLYRMYELEFALNKVRCKALITADRFKSSQYIKILQNLFPELEDCQPGQLKAKKCPSLRSIIRLGKSQTTGMFNFTNVSEIANKKDLEKLETISQQLTPHDPINIQFTSGTTGTPKGATLSHHNILNNGMIVGDGMNLTSNDRLCIPVPLYHCFGMVLGNLACVTHASAAIYPSATFDPLQTLMAVSEEKCTALHGVPTMFIAELDHPEFSKFDLSSLRTGIMAGAPCPVEVMNRVLNEMHMEGVLIAYGQTESSPVNHMTTADDSIENRVGTVGKVGPHLEIKVIDRNGDILPYGKIGEVCCKGYAVMIGYWEDNKKTKETIDEEGWLHSGDLGVMNNNGYVQITGRIKDMIIRGGENIYPREIEEFLHTHPDIKDVQIFGVPDEKLGELVSAWIQLYPNGKLTENEIRLFCADKIARYKIPHYMCFVDEFPMTITGKVQKHLMQKTMVKKIEQDVQGSGVY